MLYTWNALRGRSENAWWIWKKKTKFRKNKTKKLKEFPNDNNADQWNQGKSVRWHDVAFTWNQTKDQNVPIIRGNLDLHFEGAGNGPVVITWIGRVQELYSGASPISLVKHCVTFRHDRRLLSHLGFVHNWPTRCRWL